MVAEASEGVISASAESNRLRNLPSARGAIWTENRASAAGPTCRAASSKRFTACFGGRNLDNREASGGNDALVELNPRLGPAFVRPVLTNAPSSAHATLSGLAMLSERAVPSTNSP